MEYGLWLEGYAATGDSSSAKFLGNFEADGFGDACDKWADGLKTDDRCSFYKRDGENAFYWGCRIYGNEVDARKSFG